jgi:hypothetical protein
MQGALKSQEYDTAGKWPGGAGLAKHAGPVFGTKPAAVEPASVAEVGLKF